MFDLFCLPFAGGSKYSYRVYQDYMPEFIKMIPLEYPGRGMRSQEKFLLEMDAIAHDIFEQIQKKLTSNYYAIYGHSMGGIVAYLVTHILIENQVKAPDHLFITGTQAPAVELEAKCKRHLLSKLDFIDEIRKLNGSPNEILENDAALEYLEPILRADFTATENYRHKIKYPLSIPITVITGMQERIPEEDLRLWSRETTYNVDYKLLPGDHFFIFNYPKEISQLIAKKLIKNNI